MLEAYKATIETKGQDVIFIATKSRTKGSKLYTTFSYIDLIKGLAYVKLYKVVSRAELYESLSNKRDYISIFFRLFI